MIIMEVDNHCLVLQQRVMIRLRSIVRALKSLIVDSQLKYKNKVAHARVYLERSERAGPKGRFSEASL